MDCKRVYLLRHGQTDWNARGLLQGESDVPLNDLGREQARRANSTIKAFDPQQVWASPLSRAFETAQLATGWPAERLRVVEALAEMRVGSWASMTYSQVSRQFPEDFAAWEADPYCHAPTGGESFNDLRARLAPLAQAIADAPCERLLIVSHGQALRALLAEILDLSSDLAWRLVFDNCHYTELTYWNKPWLVRHNCPAHREGGSL